MASAPGPYEPEAMLGPPQKLKLLSTVERPESARNERPAQCSSKHGSTQARFRMIFLSDGMLQHKIL